MKDTKSLKTTEYARIKEYNATQNILDLVNREAEVFCQIENENFTKNPSVPRYEKQKKVPLSAGVINLVRQMLP